MVLLFSDPEIYAQNSTFVDVRLGKQGRSGMCDPANTIPGIINWLGYLCNQLRQHFVSIENLIFIIILYVRFKL